MGSEHKTNDETSFQPSETTLCANGCGFFGSTSTMNLCSKCYRDVFIKQQNSASVKSAMEKSLHAAPSIFEQKTEESLIAVKVSQETSPADVVKPKAKPNRCGTCNKKVGLTGFTCRCGCTFCGTHRYPEIHDCTFDFKTVGKDAIAKANPVVKADKIKRF